VYVVTLVVLCVGQSPTHSTTRVTTYTCYMYYCHNAGIDLQDFKFSVFFK